MQLGVQIPSPDTGRHLGLRVVALVRLDELIGRVGSGDQRQVGAVRRPITVSLTVMTVEPPPGNWPSQVTVLPDRAQLKPLVPAAPTKLTPVLWQIDAHMRRVCHRAGSGSAVVEDDDLQIWRASPTLAGSGISTIDVTCRLIPEPPTADVTVTGPLLAGVRSRPVDADGSRVRKRRGHIGVDRGQNFDLRRLPDAKAGPRTGDCRRAGAGEAVVRRGVYQRDLRGQIVRDHDWPRRVGAADVGNRDVILQLLAGRHDAGIGALVDQVSGAGGTMSVMAVWQSVEFVGPGDHVAAVDANLVVERSAVGRDDDADPDCRPSCLSRCRRRSRRR